MVDLHTWKLAVASVASLMAVWNRHALNWWADDGRIQLGMWRATGTNGKSRMVVVRARCFVSEGSQELWTWGSGWLAAYCGVQKKTLFW